MIIALLAIPILYLLAIMPNLRMDRKKRMASFERVYLTHRGLFNNADIPENSLSAFRKTVENGYGTELDVQLTADGKLVVFHDASLLRMCKTDRNLTECSYEELQSFRLLDTDEKIPLFEDVLKVLGEQTPIIIEIKAEGDRKKTTQLTAERMLKSRHNYSMESFHPMVVKYLKDHYPSILRGQLVYDMMKDKKNTQPWIVKFILQNMLHFFIIRPDYVANSVEHMNSLSFRIISKVYHGETVAWTVKNQEMLNRAKNTINSIFLIPLFRNLKNRIGENYETEYKKNTDCRSGFFVHLRILADV